MILRHRAALGGLQLDEVDSRIVIRGIDEAAGKETISAVGRGAGNGQRITGRRRDTLDITIRFAIRIKRTDLEAREAVLEAVNSWAAGGGWLTLGHKPGRRLWVHLAQAPGMGEVTAWTGEFALVFRSYGDPYWQDEVAMEGVSGVSSSTSFGMVMPGNAEGLIDAELQNMSGATITSATVGLGDHSMSFSGLGLGGSEALVIDHDEEGVLRIRIRSASGVYRSALALRSDTSADDFNQAGGSAMRCGFSATRACRLTVRARGRWL